MQDNPFAPRFEPTWRATVVFAAIAAVLAALGAFACATGRLDRANWLIYDILMRRHPKPPSGRVVVVGIDQATIEALGPVRRWPRENYAKLVRALDEAGALVIGLDILFASPGEPDDDAKLVKAVNDSKAFVLLAGAITGGQYRGPFEALASSENADVGVVNIVKTGSHGATSRSSPAFFPVLMDGERAHLMSFGLAAAALYESAIDENFRMDGEATGGYWTLGKHRIPEGDIMPAFAQGIGETTTVSFIDVLRGSAGKKELAGKLVMVGSTANPNDRFLVPTSREHTFSLEGVRTTSNLAHMPGVEFHATVSSSIMEDTCLRAITSSRTTPYVCGALIALLVLAILRRVPLAARVTAALIAIAGSLALLESLWAKRVFVQIAVVPAGAFTSGVLSIAFEAYLARRRNRALRGLFGRYVSPDVLKKILSDPDRVSWSEDRKVTVLFCDIRSFTPMSEKLRPAQVLEVLNTYFEAATEAVFRAGGAVDKFVGDELMAVFNSPLDQVSHARNAIHAACDIMASIDGVNQRLAAQSLPPIRIGIGLHTGPVVAGNIGSTRRAEYGIIGDTVNTAARFVDIAPPMHIYASAEVLRAAGDDVASELMERIELKGKGEPVEVYRLTGFRNPGS